MKPNLNTKLMMGLILSSLIMGAQAQDDLLFETGQVLESDQIDIDGNFNRPSAADRMAKMRQQLEKQNENMMRKKIEDIRVQQEQEMSNKLRKAFQGGLAAIDSDEQASDEVKTVQAAPQRIETVIEAPKDTKSNKVTPFFGVANYSGDNVDFESNLNLGLSLESEVSKHFSVGVNFTYSTMDITDTANTYVNNFGNYNNFGNNYGPYYNPGYYNTFGEGREMSYKRMGLDVNTKFFITADTKIRPFIGLGLGYNRSSLKYNDDGGNYNYNGINFGDEEYTSSFISGTASVGAEVNFSETIGAVVDVRYNKGLSDGFNSESTQSFNNPDQVRLENVGKSIEEAHQVSLNAGLIIRF